MMTRTRRRPDAVPPLSPAWHWSLMTGTLPPGRVPGWAAQAQAATLTADGDYDYQPAGDVLWAAHRVELIAEAAAHDFEPAWKTHREPSGAGFAEWCARFLAEHSY